MKQVTSSQIALLNVDEDTLRNFNYSLDKKRAKNKLLKGANRTENLKVEIKSGCVNLRFSNRSYLRLSCLC